LLTVLYQFVATKKDVGSSNIEDRFPRGAFPAGDTKGWLHSCFLFWFAVCFVVTYIFVVVDLVLLNNSFLLLVLFQTTNI
jgi:hypothetical protein